jgi:uncharacterized protein YjbI with pentapeptide repeats
VNVTDEQTGPMVNGWGTHPTEQRQTRLKKRLLEWDAERDHGDRRGPFDGTPLSGADVFWLAFLTVSGGMNEAEAEQLLRTLHSPWDFNNPFDLSELHLEGAGLGEAHLEDANLKGAHLRGAILAKACLRKANLSEARLEKAVLTGAHLEGADLRDATLEGANLRDATLRGAILVKTKLCEADVTRVDLQRANLFEANLQRGGFDEADLRGASLVRADLRRANLSRTLFDIETNLADAQMGDRERGFASVIDTAWNGVNLASVDWSALFPKEWWKPLSGGKLGDDRRDPHDPRVSARAHRQLALALRGQGLSAEASELDYRARIRARRDLRSKGGWRPTYLASWLNCVVSGYGYRLGRCVALYVGVVLIFSLIYCLIPYGPKASSSLHLPWWPKAVISLYLPWWPKAVILSFTSFHGRGFLPSEVMGSVWHGAWAAGEAVVGLLIEVTLIATFTQRVFR